MKHWLVSYPAILLCWIGIASPAAAQQSGVVSGTLINSLSGDPVTNATVTLEVPGLAREGKTDPDGRFSIPDVPAGTYPLVIRADGYLPFRVPLTVTGGPQTSDQQLNPQLHYSEATTVSPTGRSEFESFQATDVLGGQDLTQVLQGTLGATLENEPGIALRSFGPGPARPVVRGLDGDRVLIVEDGLRMGDLSSQSGDHGVNVNPASASSIEVVRGPATLLYGANAIGGLVNVVKNDIPRAPVMAPTGGVTLDAGSVASEGAGAGDITIGNGRIAFHASGSGRRAGHFRTPEGEVDNSFRRAVTGEVGISMTADNGYFGGSYAYDRSHYGIPFVEEGETNLNPRRQIVNIRGERRNMRSLFQSLRGSFGVRRYKHDELDRDVIATSFRNDTTELELLAGHRPVGAMRGSIGGSILTRAFSTEGAEALSPPVDQRGYAAYVYEEVAVSPKATIQFGGRVDRTSFEPELNVQARHFTNVSGSLGLLLTPNDVATVAFSFARASRNPALEELYFNGAHVGNFAFEIGEANLESEHSLGFDASVRLQHARASGEVSFFVNTINNFIFRGLTGEIRDDLPVAIFSQGDARLEGIESHVDLKVGEYWWVEGGLDYVRGTLTTTDQPLPRIPPLRGRTGLHYRRNAFQAGVEGVLTGKQDRIFVVQTLGGSVGETPTDGYNLLKLFASYSFASGRAAHTITVRLDNVTNELYHNHLNYLKDLMPETGRDFRVVYSVKF
jgi:iron complex outermembrane receptor protein